MGGGDNLPDSVQNRHTGHGSNEAPPPPYTETDIYSNSGGPRTPPLATVSARAVDDDGASRISSSVDGGVLTPTSTAYAATSPQQPASSAAASFFQDRPPPAVPPQGVIEHYMTVHATSEAGDFPYAVDLAARDVDAQDWATFVNFLLPRHAERENDAVADRKMRSLADEKSPAPSETHAYARSQLDQLQGDASDGGGLDMVQFAQHAEETVQEWNTNFFHPRGIAIHLNLPDSTPSAQQSRETPTPTPGVGGGSWSQRFGGFQMDNDGIRYGNQFVMDSNGIRIGGLVMDSAGIRMGHSTREEPDIRARQSPMPQTSQHPSGPPPWNDAYYGRGRMPQPGGPRHRRDSSSSSTSSDSSSSSESSVGSVPDHDDLNERQLPMYTARLQVWLRSPDEIRTRADVKQLKADLKAVKREPGGPEVNVKALRAEAKATRKEWRQLQKQQRKARREVRKENRKRKNEERKRRKEERKMHRKAKREGKRPQRPDAHHWAPPPHPHMPPHMPCHHGPPRGFPFDHHPPHPMSWTAPGASFPPPPPPFAPYNPFGGPGGHNNGPEAPRQQPGNASPPPPPPAGPAAEALQRAADSLEAQIRRKTAIAADTEDSTVRAALEKEVQALNMALEGMRMSMPPGGGADL
ncbi:hypothetical protein B0I35DRAFT_120054 [Stachybotrys elegans]|uniref:Uncharacterized protein n=1 Tax=Stachybotrys elegans TaxID=80388 RepID=A0A8K0T2I4_9HYPO|nr:hypothetical protein B0I35DRAFT_120054 [Stachybotrys elegans]